MGKIVYYCEVLEDHTTEFSKGIIAIPWKREYHTKIQRCISYSHKVWVQGYNGGVKVIKDRTGTFLFGYVTRNKEAMKQFMWVKLKAQSLANYT